MRLQLALNVPDLAEAVAFYGKMFNAEPARERPGYANFAINEPPLKLVLFENPDAEPGSLNHLGVEVETKEEVAHAEARLNDEGIGTTGVDDTECCWATKTETWVNAPDGNRWEWYVRTGDAEHLGNTVVADSDGHPQPVCCG